jgi:hypothetical protein
MLQSQWSHLRSLARFQQSSSVVRKIHIAREELSTAASAAAPNPNNISVFVNGKARGSDTCFSDVMFRKFLFRKVSLSSKLVKKQESIFPVFATTIVSQLPEIAECA